MTTAPIISMPSSDGLVKHHKMSIAFLTSERNDMKYSNTTTDASCNIWTPSVAASDLATHTKNTPRHQPTISSKWPVKFSDLYNRYPLAPSGHYNHMCIPQLSVSNKVDGRNFSKLGPTMESSHIQADLVKQHNRWWTKTSVASSTSCPSKRRLNTANARTSDQQSRSTDTRRLFRIPRRARPAYSDEQKFFIMYYRIAQNQSWPEIEDRFAQLFKMRSKDGLTSVYYRTRKEWGMKDVLKTGSDCSLSDYYKIKEKANSISYDFLRKLEYCP
jgi:hypothetical protein